MNQQPNQQNSPSESGPIYYYHPEWPEQNHFESASNENQNQQEQRRQAKQITAKGQWIGAALLAVQIIGSLAILALEKFMNWILPGASQNPSVFYDAIEYAVYSPLAILVPFWIIASFCKTPLSQIVPFEKHSFGLSLGCMLASFWGIAAGNYAAGMVGTAFPQIEEALEAALGVNPTTPMELIVNLLYLAAIPALVEEFAFRGVAMGLLRPYGDRFALVASSLLFALLHGNFIQIPFALCVGLSLGYATLRTGSLVPAIVVHFVNNACSCVLDYFDSQLVQWFGEAYGILLYVLWGLLGLVGFLILMLGHRKQGITACFTPYQGCLSTGRRIGSFYRAGLLIAAMALYLLSAVLIMVPV